MLYLLLKMVHIIGAAVLLGTGAGIAFFMLVAHLLGDPREVAGVARTVVLADFLFTASAVILQPITGTWLAWSSGYSLRDGWIAASIALYVVTGAFWLFVGPFLIGLIVFVYVPIVWSVVLSFSRAQNTAKRMISCEARVAIAR